MAPSIGNLFAIFLTLALLPFAVGFEIAAALAGPKIAISFAGINPRQTPLWIAQEQGFFSKHGVDADVVFIRTGPIQVAAVSSGATQLAYAGPGGKRFGVQAIGGSVWMGAVLGLEYLGLDQRRDNINILNIGDQTVLAQAMESGTIDVTVLDGVFSRRLKQKGFSVIAELSETKIPYVSNVIVGTRALFQQQPELAENILKALLESLAFILAPPNKAAVVNTIMKRLKITDGSVAEQGYRDLVQISDPKPYVSLDGLRNIQRLIKIQNPIVGNVKVEDLIDNRPLKKLEDSGFIQKTFSAYGMK